jgi:hypothetical protein
MPPLPWRNQEACLPKYPKSKLVNGCGIFSQMPWRCHRARRIPDKPSLAMPPGYVML